MLNSMRFLRSAGAVLAAVGAVVAVQPAAADPLALFEPQSRYPSAIFEEVMPQQIAPEESVVPEPDQSAATLPQNLRRQIVAYSSREATGTVVIDTPNKYLYYVLGGGQAIRYGIGVGREGFTWSGVKSVERKAEWPDWIPPAEMIQRQPYLPRFMAGGPGNPLGARAMYIAGTQYRIHGTNAPSTIGHNVSSGCIRMLNEDVIDLYNRVNVGAKIVVLPAHEGPAIASRQPQRATSVMTIDAPSHNAASIAMNRVY
jgi:lipoprotein-anchoring transpeptidase ErfK/SrfK